MGFDPISAGIMAVSSIAGGLISSDAAGDAADVQVQGSDRAVAAQERMFNTINKQNEPYRRTSEQGLNMLLSGLRKGGELDTTSFSFMEDPGFQFAISKGINALNSGSAARTGSRSGGAAKALANYTTGAASQQYNDAFNRFQTERMNRSNQLLSLSGLGTSANATTAGAGSQAATTMANATIAGSQAAASGLIGGANAVTGGMSNLANIYAQNQYMESILGSKK